MLGRIEHWLRVPASLKLPQSDRALPEWIAWAFLPFPPRSPENFKIRSSPPKAIAALRRIRRSSPALCYPTVPNSTSAGPSPTPAIPSTWIIRIAPNPAFSAAPVAAVNDTVILGWTTTLRRRIRLPVSSS